MYTNLKFYSAPTKSSTMKNTRTPTPNQNSFRLRTAPLLTNLALGYWVEKTDFMWTL